VTKPIGLVLPWTVWGDHFYTCGVPVELGIDGRGRFHWRARETVHRARGEWSPFAYATESKARRAARRAMGRLRAAGVR
jgi:hypothetical protein